MPADNSALQLGNNKLTGTIPDIFQATPAGNRGLSAIGWVAQAQLRDWHVSHPAPGDFQSLQDPFLPLRWLVLYQRSVRCVFPDIARTRRILDLANNGLVGTVPSSLSTLTALSSLKLSGNYLTGSLLSTYFNGNTLL
jgi:hypothetical protein